MSGTVVPRKPVCETMTSTDSVRALQDLSRRADAADLDVAPEGLPADADGEDRHLARAKPEQRFLDRRFRRVGAVGHHHEPGQRQSGELVLRALERFAEPASACR